MNPRANRISRRVSALLGVSLLAGLLAGCQTPRDTARQDGHFRAHLRTEVALSYQLHLPTDYATDSGRRWPLLLFLHGAGERGTNLNAVSVHGPPKLIQQGKSLPLILLAPQCPADQVWNTPVLLQLLDRVQKQYRVDPSKIYVTGLSMGGYGTWSLLSTDPARFAAAAPICGGGDTIPLLLLPAQARKSLQTLPVWAFHGAKDGVVPEDETHRMVRAAQRAGASRIKTTIYPDADHDSWSRTYDNPEFWSWLLQQSR